MHGNDGRGAMTMPALIGLPLRKGGTVRPFHNRWCAAVSGAGVRAAAPILLGLLSVHLLVAYAESQKVIDTQRSILTVHVFKAGMFSTFGHEHNVRALIQNGAFDESKGTVEFAVDARTMEIRDADVSDKDRAEIQKTMLGPKVLDSEQFHEIRFHSTQISPAGENKWTVQGDLTLHGKTHPVKVEAERQGEKFRGSARLRQTEFGITPVTVAGGAVKVKDEVQVEFEVFGK
jgi:polyisoprenoid-binding protein YceI